jgi:hypothetical protein
LAAQEPGVPPELPQGDLLPDARWVEPPDGWVELARDAQALSLDGSVPDGQPVVLALVYLPAALVLAYSPQASGVHLQQADLPDDLPARQAVRAVRQLPGDGRSPA